MCQSRRGINDDGDPYSSGEKNQSTIEVIFLAEDRVESVLVPERSDRINQEIHGNWRRCDKDRDCCVEARDVPLEEGYGTCNEEGIDGRHLVVERVFHSFWRVEYEDSWRGDNINGTRQPFVDARDSLKQNAVM